MAAVAIHVVPDNNFDDWVVRPDIGQEFGHYLTREAAERIAQAIAREREAELAVHLRTEERAERVLQKAGPPDCSGDDPAASDDGLLHLHAVDMLAGPCQQLRQGHDTGLAQSPGRGAQASVSVCFGWRTAAAVPVRRRCRP